jgi:hypothetical protein
LIRPALAPVRAAGALLLLLAPAGCRSHGSAPVPSSQPAPVSVAPPPSPAGAGARPSVDPQAAAEIIVGSKRGLEAWRRDGSGKRMISKGAARYPRWLDQQSVVVLRPASENDLAQGGRLERIALADGKRSRLAKLAPFACLADPDGGDTPDASDPFSIPMTLDLQEQTDFVIDASGRFACLTLMDRNINMSSVTLFVRVDLQSGASTRWFDAGEESCRLPEGVTPGEHDPDAACSPREPVRDPAPAATSFQFAFEDEQVIEQQPAGGHAARVRLPGYTAQEASPSGRWVVLDGDVEEGDYIHRQLVLLDRTTGDIFPIPTKAGPWRPPLKPAGKKAPPRIATPVKNTAGVVGESDVRWLGQSSASELLVVDTLIVRPGLSSFDVRGEVAR